MKTLPSSNPRRPRVAAMTTALITASVGRLLFYTHRPTTAVDGSGERGGPGQVAADVEPSLRPQLAHTASTGSVEGDGLPGVQLRCRPARRGNWPQRPKVTGRLELNENRIACVSPVVEGVVRQTCVEIGQEVKRGQILAQLDSNEVADAKLSLVKDRLELEVATSLHERNKSVLQNTCDLIAGMESGESIATINERFRGRAIGSPRGELVSALVQRDRSAADYRRLSSLQGNGVIAEKEVILAKAEYESARAAFQAIREEAKLACEEQVLLSQQHLKQAETALVVSQSRLLALGYRPEELPGIDPIAEGERVAHYRVRAPIDGTVVEKHAVLTERVERGFRLFRIADLSTVWLRAHLPEQDMGVARTLTGKTVTFVASGCANRRFTATVISLESEVAHKAGSVQMLASAHNTALLLKPGMSVEVDLGLGQETGVLQVQASAVQRDHNARFVFVSRAGGEFERRDVVVGRSIGQIVEILSGIEEGDPVLVDGIPTEKSQTFTELLAEQ